MTRTDFWVIENIDTIQSYYGLALVGGPSGSPYWYSPDLFLLLPNVIVMLNGGTDTKIAPTMPMIKGKWAGNRSNTLILANMLRSDYDPRKYWGKQYTCNPSAQTKMEGENSVNMLKQTR